MAMAHLCEQFSGAGSTLRGDEKLDSETLPKRWAATARLQARLTVLQHQLQEQEQQLNLFTSVAAGSKSKQAAGLPSLKASCILSAQRQPVTTCAFHPFLPQLLAGADDGSIRVSHDPRLGVTSPCTELHGTGRPHIPFVGCPALRRLSLWKEQAVRLSREPSEPITPR